MTKIIKTEFMDKINSKKIIEPKKLAKANKINYPFYLCLISIMILLGVIYEQNARIQDLQHLNMMIGG